jgi:hypothetical protein
MAYVRLGDNMVHPMVHRLQRARDALKLLTGGSLDILGAEQFAYLRRAAEEPIPAPTQDVELEADA